MTCSCSFSEWMREWLMSFGASMPFIALALVLLWWGTRAARMEHFTARMRFWQAVLLNLRMIVLYLLAILIILVVLFMHPGAN